MRHVISEHGLEHSDYESDIKEGVRYKIRISKFPKLIPILYGNKSRKLKGKISFTRVLKKFRNNTNEKCPRPILKT